ncbi:MAG TPA: GNAT family N-acetyltransferase [Mycobacteriales bacterium]
MTVLATVDVRSGPRLVLREAVRADVPALVSLLAQDQLGARRDGIAGAADLRAYEAAFEEIDRDPAHLLVVAETPAGAVAGTMQLSVLPGLARRGSRRAQIEAVRVAESHRGQGLGSAMIRWALAEAGRRGCALVQLTTDKRRADAHRFYERLGFVASHEGMKLRLVE